MDSESLLTRTLLMANGCTPGCGCADDNFLVDRLRGAPLDGDVLPVLNDLLKHDAILTALPFKLEPSCASPEAARGWLKVLRLVLVDPKWAARDLRASEGAMDANSEALVRSFLLLEQDYLHQRTSPLPVADLAQDEVAALVSEEGSRLKDAVKAVVRQQAAGTKALRDMELKGLADRMTSALEELNQLL